jgi:hypothetical protein
MLCGNLTGVPGVQDNAKLWSMRRLKLLSDGSVLRFVPLIVFHSFIQNDILQFILFIMFLPSFKKNYSAVIVDT